MWRHGEVVYRCVLIAAELQLQAMVFEAMASKDHSAEWLAQEVRKCGTSSYCRSQGAMTGSVGVATCSYPFVGHVALKKCLSRQR